MTSNHPEKLDPALIRPGRVDLQVKLDNASRNQLARMLKKFFPEATKDQMEHFSDSLPDKRLSLAKVQGHMVKYQDSLQQAIENLGELTAERQERENYKIAEYLHELNLPHLIEGFKKKRYILLSDLNNFNMEFNQVGCDDF